MSTDQRGGLDPSLPTNSGKKRQDLFKAIPQQQQKGVFEAAGLC
jgi:hypothetical protein